MPSKLYHTIIVVGASFGIGGGTAAVTATGVLSGCDSSPPTVDASHGIIDAPFGTIADAPWGIIDATLPIDGPADAGVDAKPDGGAT